MTRFLTFVFLPLLTLSAWAVQVKSGQVGPPVDSNQPASGKATSGLAPSQIFNRARPAVVVIVADDQYSQREALGSGFLVSRDQIATNHHVVEGMKEAYVVFSDGVVKRVSGVVADSVQQDLIILKVETGNRPALLFGDELSLQQGDPVFALGAPKGLQLSFTNGIVSSFRKSEAQFLIQTTAPIAPGSSGGPLFDGTGRVVGVTTSMISDAPGIYFSVGIGDLRRLLRTPQGVALPFEEWARKQKAENSSLVESQENQAGEASLKDTVFWMHSFSNAHGSRLGVNSEPLSWSVIFGEGCEVRVGHFSLGKHLPDVAEADSLDLRDVDPQSIKVESSSEVSFETTNSSLSIHREETLMNDNTKKSDIYVDYLSFDSAENAKRFATALKHAVNLCGGTTAPF
jgi:trypsin-like peptidase